MRLRDPDNAARWADGEPRSTNNAFAIGLACVDWVAMETSRKQREAQSRRIERQREAGDPEGVIARLKGAPTLMDAKSTAWNGALKQQKKKVSVDIEPKQHVQATADKREKLRRGASI